MPVTKKDIIERIQSQFMKASFLYDGDGKRFISRRDRGQHAVASFYKNASVEERAAMQEITSEELFGIAAKDTMMYEMLKLKPKRGMNGLTRTNKTKVK